MDRFPHSRIPARVAAVITQSRLREVLRYDPISGHFTWLKRLSNHAVAGKRAGAHSTVVRVRVDDELYLAHRLAWFYMTGKFPKFTIDHINGNALDNSWKNLRDVSRRMNMENQRRARIDNKLGILGVHRRRNGFKAQIQVNGKPMNIGDFKTAEEAHKAYLRAKRKYHAGCTI